MYLVSFLGVVVEGSFPVWFLSGLVDGLLGPLIIGQFELYCMSFDGREQWRGRAIRAYPLGVAGRSRNAYNTGKFVVCVVPQVQLILGSMLLPAYLMKWQGL